MKTEELSVEEAASAWGQKKRVEAMGPQRDGWGLVTPIGGGKSLWSPEVFTRTDRVFMFRLAPEPPVVGTAEWANSLPEGTKLRINAGAWTRGRFTEKRNGVWSQWSAYSWTPDDGPNTGWELYTEPPAKKWRPWEFSDVPVGALTRPMNGDGDALMIVGKFSTGALIAGDRGVYPFADLLRMREHSLDNGKTWLPCGVEVVK